MTLTSQLSEQMTDLFSRGGLDVTDVIDAGAKSWTAEQREDNSENIELVGFNSTVNRQRAHVPHWRSSFERMQFLNNTPVIHTRHTVLRHEMLQIYVLDLSLTLQPLSGSNLTPCIEGKTALECPLGSLQLSCANFICLLRWPHQLLF